MSFSAEDFYPRVGVSSAHSQLAVSLLDAAGAVISDGPDAATEVSLSAAGGLAGQLSSATRAGAPVRLAPFSRVSATSSGDLRLVATATLASDEILSATSPGWPSGRACRCR